MGFGAGGGPGKHQSMLPGGGKGGSGHQKMPQQGSRKRPSEGSHGMGARMGKGSMGGNRGYKSFSEPTNDGNLYTSRAQSARRTSSATTRGRPGRAAWAAPWPPSAR